MTLLVVLPESSGEQIRSFSLSVLFHHSSPCSYITRVMNNRPIGGCSSEMLSHPVNIIIVIIIMTFILTNSVAQETKGSSLHSQQPATGPCPEPVGFQSDLL
jgi:hypothetical protein